MTQILAKSLAVVLVFLACVAQSSAKGQSPNNSSFVLIEQTENSWKFEFVPAQIPSATIDIDGVPYRLFVGGAVEMEGEPGKPQLPVEALSLGVPAGAGLRAEIVDPVYNDLTNQLVAPNPSYTYSEERDAIAHYSKDNRWYFVNRFFPSQSVVVGSPYTLREQRIVTIKIAPFQYNPSTKILRQLVRATLNVRMVSSSAKPLDLSTVPAPPDPQFENIYKDLISNYDQAKQWRQPIDLRRTDQAVDPTRDWFETGQTYYRIRIANDGWYKVTKTDLAAAGANTSQIDINTLKVFGKGREIPVMIRPDTTIEFYAMMNHGDSTYLDFYTDTSSYWVTWGGAVQGLRFAPTPQQSNPPSTNIVSAKASRHFEQNNWYYPGSVDQELIDNDAVPGEGWAWGTQPEWFYVGTTKTFPFVLDSIDRSITSSTVRVRLFGANSVSAPPLVSQRARFWVNDSLVGDIIFAQRSEGFLSTAFPTAFLANGTSILKISSVSTPGSPGLFFLDWFEVDYQRILRAQNNQLLFTSPQSSGPSPALFTVHGFSNPQIDVFDLSGNRLITGGTISGDSLSGYSIAFKDTFSISKTYLAVCAGGQRSALPLSAKQFTDIRVNPAGTDYLIIAHRLFRTAAERLRLQRQNINGVRARIIYVDEIYDEFNYGVMNSWAIKNFLKYAYLNWTAPRLAYVVMFGDACWDYHRYISTTTQTNFVPAYGVPAGDNWYGCFNPDTAFIPSLLIGRLPVRDTIQADHMVTKLINYDSYTLEDWNKNFMFITGGITPAEWLQFNGLSDLAINTYVLPPPIGGTPYRVYKNTTGVIDGENKQLMRDLVRDGLVYMNFLGHSGGVVWGVDIGDPNTLENTNGKLPFLSSVSCNVGAFADGSRTMLAEEFVLADNRGSVASWASSGLGYANAGAMLNQYFLNGITNGVRDIGSLTTAARFRLWQVFGSGYIYVGMVKLNPLLGDPLTRIAIPPQPDLAITMPDVLVTPSTPTPNDSTITVRAAIHNYGLVPADSVGVTIIDTYNGQSTPIIANKQYQRTLHCDTLYVPWSATEKIGRHTLTVTLDPTSAIPEVSEINNATSVEQYVYANLLSIVKPLNNMVVSPGAQTLLVTSPLGLDSLGFQYYFELDTVATFDSPFKVSSPAVMPGPVSGQWTTPSLANNTVYFWRARTIDGTLQGNWVVSAFVTSSFLPVSPLVRWREYSPRQFAREVTSRTTVADSGVIIAPNPALNLISRSFGSRATASSYCTIMLNGIVVTGYTYVIGNSLMGMRVNEFDGHYDIGGGVGSAPWNSDSMLAFIRNTPVGNYLAFSSLLNVRLTLNESLYVALDALGSTMSRQVQPGQSWAFIGRKGYPAAAMEVLTDDSAIVSLQIPNYFSFGSGSITTTGMPIATSWDSFHWRNGSSPPANTATVALFGIRSNGVADTLRILPRDSVDVSIASLNALTSGPTYTSFRSTAVLSTSDALVTPVLKDWWVDFVPPADLAVSARTVGPQEASIQKGSQLGLQVTVHNIGFHGVDSARVIVSVFDKFNRARPVAFSMLDTIPVNGTKSAVIPIGTSDFSRRVTLQINVSPSKKYKDLIQDNNNAYYTFNVVGAPSSGIRMFADGVQLMDGDYVAAKPRLVVRLPKAEDGQGVKQVEFFVDGKTSNTLPGNAMGMEKISIKNDDLMFAPELPDGRHELRVRTIEMNSLSGLDTLEQALVVNVLSQLHILQLYNYPNPFSTDTYFTFVLTGRDAPEELRIRIFTIAGRRIRELVIQRNQIQVGMNRVYWDGRDSDGDELSNGYYFYQVAIKGEGKTETSIQKLAKIR